jgi:L,D-transpeptidase ErfK/SrfK
MDRPVAASVHYGVAVGLLSILVTLSGCQSLGFSKPGLAPPIATDAFEFDAARDEVVGTVQIIKAREEDTLSDIARRFNLGYEEIVSANPDVDPWLPRAGTEIVLPTQFVLPDAPREGIVINLAAMRLFYFPPAQAGATQRVITHPLGIGRVEWKTPEGKTRIVTKKAAPSWIPTASIRKEHAANGDPLPAKVPPGPDNPLGTHVLKLGWQNYSIHGTDKPPSIGLRGSHGCLRMYPEDIVRIYDLVPVGTSVRVVNQPQLFGWRGNALYLQSYPVLEDDKRRQDVLMNKQLTAAMQSPKAKLDARSHMKINQDLIDEMTTHPRAIAIPVSQQKLTTKDYLSHVLRVQNQLPLNASWAGEVATKTD